MRVCVLGGSGMLGHVVCNVLARNGIDVIATFRHKPSYALHAHIIADFDAYDLPESTRRLRDIEADAFVNCIGVIKHQPGFTHRTDEVIAVNSAFPHLVARIARETHARLIHFSTDCVFSGDRGNYTEDEVPDATDLYGRSKALGEPTAENVLVLRTSIIGPELRIRASLLEWLISHRGMEVPGFRRAFFSGLTTFETADILLRLLREHPDLSGIFHLAGERISKYDLLMLLNRSLELGAEIVPDDSFVIDRSLNGKRFQQATGITPSTWDEMASQLAQQMRRLEVTA